MMVYEPVTVGGLNLFHVYSDAGRKIRLEGTDEQLDEVIFPMEEMRAYEETDVPVDALKEEAPEAVRAVFGEYISAERAAELRPVIEAAVQAKQSDAEALATPELYGVWTPGTQYETGARIRYNGVLYKVLQAHTSQGGWTPAAAPSLFAEILTSDDGTPLPWVQPDSTNPYMTGDRVIYNDKTYESVIDNNVWSPDAYPAGWKEV